MRDSGPSVFVVDDEVAIGQLIVHVLGDEGFNVTIFATGRAALAALEAGAAPDVALVDLWMADPGGEEVCRRILELGLDTACVVVSALNNAHEVAERLGLPLLRKPFDIETLIDTVTALCPPRSPDGAVTPSAIADGSHG